MRYKKLAIDVYDEITQFMSLKSTVRLEMPLLLKLQKEPYLRLLPEPGLRTSCVTCRSFSRGSGIKMILEAFSLESRDPKMPIEVDARCVVKFCDK